MFRLLLMVMLLPLTLQAKENPPQHRGEFTMRYAQFIHEFQGRHWQQMKKYETEITKCGFGPGKEGIGCIEKVYSNNHECINEVLFSLKQGCKVHNSKGEILCISPPQWNDQSIIILGARASFTYNAEKDTISVNHLICGGD
ncbi:MAG: hypothetical protein D3909_09370 [Candidatus Electrothrix sp. ATG1]|nr:hypothetical protein [Candidatus Electrothrix sp. ATG1]